MKKRIILSVVVVLAWAFFATLFYKTLMLMLLLLVWQKKLRERYSLVEKYHLARWVWIVLALLLWVAMPRYRINSGDRVRLVYLDDNGDTEHPPLLQYAMSTLVPEAEVVNFTIKNFWFFRIFSNSFGVGGKMGDQVQSDIDHGKIHNFLTPYKMLGFDNPVSGVYPQFFNETFGTDYCAVNIICPKQMEDERKYPLVVFCHGYLGNWQLYQGIWQELDNCIVLSIGTRGLDGVFSQSDIDKIFSYYIPALEKMDYHIDHSDIHLMGLSNGGSAINAAMHSSHVRQFKSLTTISCNLSSLRRVPCQVNFIGGGNDGSAKLMPQQHRALQRMGVRSEIFFDETENHFVLVNRRQDIIDFINGQMLQSDNAQ